MRVPHFSVYVFLCIFTAVLSADNYIIEWADTVDNNNWDGASAVAVDHSCNIIVVGSSYIAGNTDYFIVKYDSSGSILWTDTLDNGDEDYAEAVAVDNNNIVVTGYCRINGDYDYYTVKYDSSGVLLWEETLDNSGQYDIARGVAIDNGQNIVVTGYCDIEDDCVYFTVKYDAGGSIIWTDTLDNGYYDSALDVAVDGVNNIIVTGYTTTGNNNDYYTVKYDSSGTILWQEIIDLCQFDQAYGIAVDNSKNVIVTGCSGEAFSDYDFLTVKYDSAGTIIWIDTLDYEDSDDVAYDICVDSDNNIYVTGYSLHLAGDYDFYTVKYDSAGTVLWEGILDNGNDDIAFGIAVDEQDNIIVTGRSNIGGNFDYFTVKYAPSPGISEQSDRGLCYSVFKVSPNPLKDRTEITYNAGQNSKNVEIRIYDITGRLVKSFTSPTANALLPITISWDGTDNSGSELPGGVYYLMIEKEKQRATKKLLLIR